MLNRKPFLLGADLHPRNPLQITPQIADWRCGRSRRGNDTFTHLICLSCPTPSISDNGHKCGCPIFGGYFAPKVGSRISDRPWPRPSNNLKSRKENCVNGVVFSSQSDGKFNQTGRIWRTLMGREAICDCTFDGTTTKVKALLESEELILRGEIRLRCTLP